MYQNSLHVFSCLQLLGCQRSNNTERTAQTEAFTFSPQNNYLSFEFCEMRMVCCRNLELYLVKKSEEFA